MKKYEIYQVGKVPPLTVIEVDDWTLGGGEKQQYIYFYKNKEIIAIFNWNNIAGFKEVSNDE